MAIIVAAAVIFAGLGSPQKEVSETDSDIRDYVVNEQFKPITLRDKSGATVVLSSQLPEKTLITFWDATCAECRIGLPLIASFISAHPEIKPIYINHLNAPEQADQAIREMGLGIETLFDSDGSVFTQLSGTMPATYFIRNGQYRVFFPGRPSAEQLNALLTVE